MKTSPLLKTFITVLELLSIHGPYVSHPAYPRLQMNLHFHWWCWWRSRRKCRLVKLYKIKSRNSIACIFLIHNCIICMESWYFPCPITVEHYQNVFEISTGPAEVGFQLEYIITRHQKLLGWMLEESSGKSPARWYGKGHLHSGSYG